MFPSDGTGFAVLHDSGIDHVPLMFYRFLPLLRSRAAAADGAAQARICAMSTLIMVRHGESEWNDKGLFTGWVDARLSERGEAEAEQAG